MRFSVLGSGFWVLVLSSWFFVLSCVVSAQNPQALLNRAVDQFEKRQFAESARTFDELAKIIPDEAPQLWQRGIALYYAGRVDDALAQFRRSLDINPKHAQTLFNLGIVKRDARNDAKGAIETWEQLLASVPDYPDAGKVRTMIAELKTRTS